MPLPDFITFEAEDAKTIQGSPIVTPRNYDERIHWTGEGFNRLPPYSGIEFPIDYVPSSKYYDAVVRYEPETSGNFKNAQLMIKRPYGIDPYGPCGNYSTTNDIRQISLLSNERTAIVDSICLEKGQRYQMELNTNEFDRPAFDQSPSILIDSVCFFVCFEFDE